MFEYKPDINDLFEFKWVDYGDKNMAAGKIYGSLIGKFEIGQGVIVVRDMNFYSNYVPMLNAMGFEKELMRSELHNGECGVVVGRKYHENKNDLIYGVRVDDYKIAIISEKGLKKNKDYIKLLDDKLFEI